MSSKHRLGRLRELIARIEQLPASAESERMLREVRARLVDVDTGVTPRAMLPPDPVLTAGIEAGASAANAPKAVARKPAEQERGRPAATPAAAHTITAEDREWLSLVATNKVLSLDDADQPPGEPRAGNDRRPWTRGLRG